MANSTLVQVTPFYTSAPGRINPGTVLKLFGSSNRQLCAQSSHASFLETAVGRSLYRLAKRFSTLFMFVMNSSGKPCSSAVAGGYASWETAQHPMRR